MIGKLQGNGEILVVDDEDSVRHFTKAVLRSRGFSVLEAEDGVQALEVYRGAETPPRAVVLDVSMPRMNGREVLHELRKLDADVPVLLTTGYDTREIEDGADHGGHTGFLGKPYRSADLVKALQGLLVGTGSEAAIVD